MSINFISELETFALQLLWWLFLIPKTLIKVLWNPEWVPDYLDEQLQKETNRFTDYASPLLLLAFLVICLYGILEFSFTRMNTPLKTSGPNIAKVGEKSVFYVEEPSFWQGYSPVAVEAWNINNTITNEEIYRLVRYDNDERSLNNVNIEKVVDFLDGGNSSQTAIVKIGLSRIPAPFRVYKLEYAWQETGYYNINLTLISHKGDFASNFGNLRIVVVEEVQSSIPPLPNSPSTGTLEYHSLLENRERAYFLVVAVLLAPLWISLSEELLFRRKLPKQSTIYQSIYAHSMYISPLVMSVLIFSLSVINFLQSSSFFTFNNWIRDTTESNFAIIATLLVTTAFFAWFFVVEVRYFSQKYSCSILISSGITVIIFYLPYFAYLKLEGTTFKDFWIYGYIALWSVYFLGIFFIKAIPSMLKRIFVKRKLPSQKIRNDS